MDNEKNPEIKEETLQEERENELGEELDEGAEEELDLDEDGNIMIPDEEEEAEEEPEDEPEEEEEPEEDAEEEPSGEEDAEDHAAEPPAEDPEKATLRAEKDEATRKYDALLAQARETLKKLGHNADDPLAALVQIAAESEGKSTEEYLREKAEKQSAEEAQAFMRRTQFQAKKAADLAAVHAAYPDTRGYDDVDKLPNAAEFKRLRDLGLSPKQAYIAANPDGVRESVAAATKQQSLNDTKNHMKPAVSKGAKDNSIRLSKSEMAMYRDMFPEKSDKEILALYREATR